MISEKLNKITKQKGGNIFLYELFLACFKKIYHYEDNVTRKEVDSKILLNLINANPSNVNAEYLYAVPIKLNKNNFSMTSPYLLQKFMKQLDLTNFIEIKYTPSKIYYIVKVFYFVDLFAHDFLILKKELKYHLEKFI